MKHLTPITLDLTTSSEHYKTLRLHAALAEYLQDWKWIGFDYFDVSYIQHQFWLLPDVMATHDVTPGEWTYLEEDDETRWKQEHLAILPTWLPQYTASMGEIWPIVRRVTEPSHSDEYREDLYWNLFETSAYGDTNGFEVLDLLYGLTPMGIALAALKTEGIQVRL